MHSACLPLQTYDMDAVRPFTIPLGQKGNGKNKEEMFMEVLITNHWKQTSELSN